MCRSIWLIQERIESERFIRVLFSDFIDSAKYTQVLQRKLFSGVDYQKPKSLGKADTIIHYGY